MKRCLKLAGLAVALILVGCASTTKEVSADGADPELEELNRVMTGWFDSADQAASDPDNYFHIRLVMLPIMERREDGKWLYVEQAAASALDRPYRQRVYHLHRNPAGDLVSDVYSFKEAPLRFAGAWQRDRGLADMSLADLALRDGCSIILKRAGRERYLGATQGKNCVSTIRGASYATSEVEITAKKLESWDQGWNADDEQVWGATEGAYVFIKRGDDMPPDTMTTPGGVAGVTLTDEDWFLGEWEPVFPRTGPVEVTRRADGVCSMTEQGGLTLFSEMRVFEVEGRFIAEVLLDRGNGETQMMYASLEGYSERLSVNFLPAMFPMAWEDSELAAMIPGIGTPIPPERRAEALAVLAASVPEKGTFMLQDYTYYRPGAGK